MLWLIAEDEADILNLMKAMCQMWGHTVMAFESGQKVWNWLDEVEAGRYSGSLPEFVLMDIRMPGKKGNECAQRMRTINGLRDIPIALMTAFSLNAEERETMLKRDGVDQIINKPLPGFEDLRGVLEGIIQAKRSSVA